MSRVPSILVAAAFASMSAGALAADHGVKVARDQAKATYDMDKSACAPLKGGDRKRCLDRAKAEYDQQRASVRDMEKARDQEKKEARAEKRDAKRRLSAHSGGDDSYEQSESKALQLPSPGAQSDLSKPTAKHVPGMTMGKAPVSANSPN